jgi:hypothetical protein
MVVRRRSGLATHRRAYGISESRPVIPTYSVIYNGNTNTGGISPVDGSSPYTDGSTVTVLGNAGPPILANSGFTFGGWNTASNGSGTQYSQGNTFTINADTILYAQWTPLPIPPPPPPPSPPPPPGSVSAPISLSSVGGNQAAYILFTQSGIVTNYEYSTDNGETFVPFSPAQIYSPVEITTLSSDVETRLTNGITYTIKLRAVNSGESSSDSLSVDVVPTVNSLATANRIIYLDANNSSSYSGTGSTWTNLDSGGSYSATLNGSPPFNSTDANNKYFDFNRAAATGQFAQIGQATAINPVANQPFTIQMWVRINNVGSQGSLVSKVFGAPSYDGYALGYRTDSRLQLHANGSQVNYFDSVTGVVSNEWTLYTANIQFGNGGGRQNKLFVNGRQILSVTSTDNISASTQNLTFPTGFYGEGECDIGQFYYYNTELTRTQIIQNYDATKSRYTD